MPRKTILRGLRRHRPDAASMRPRPDAAENLIQLDPGPPARIVLQ